MKPPEKLVMMDTEIKPEGKGRAGKILFRACMAMLIMVTVLLFVVAIILNTIATPKRITPILLSLAHEFVEGEVACESVDITFFSTFPNLGVKLKNGSISSATDTLVAFETCVVAINPVAFLSDNKVIVHRLEIENANIYAFVDTLGKANWDIFITPESNEEKSSYATAQELPELNINNISLRNVSLIYEDLQQDFFVMADSLNMKLTGNLSKERANLSLGIRTSALTTYFGGQAFTQNLSVGFFTQLIRDRVAKTLAIEKGALNIGVLELKTHGMLQQKDTVGHAWADIDFSLNASSLEDVFNMIPKHVSELTSKLVPKGRVETSGKISGLIGKGNLPVITLSARLIDGSLTAVKYPGKPLLEDIDMEASALLDFSGKQTSSLTFHELYVQGADSKLSATGILNDILTNPAIDVQAKANVNFTGMSQKLSLEGISMDGLIDFDISVKCLLDEILTSDYGKINANGYANISDVMFNFPAEDFSFYTSNAEIRFESNTRDSIRGKLHESLLKGKMSLDTLDLNQGGELTANASRLSVVFSTSAPKDSGSIAPIMIGGRVRNLRFAMGDSIRMRAVTVSGSIHTKSRTDFPRLPEVSAKIMLDTLSGRFYEAGGRISKTKMELKLVKQEERRGRMFGGNRVTRDSVARPAAFAAARDTISNRAAFAAARDTIRRPAAFTRARMDSLRKNSLDPTTNITFQVESQATRDILRNWEISGSVSIENARVRTPYFPIPIRMGESDMSFTTNTLKVNRTHIKLGESDFRLKGEIEGIRRALLRNGKITARMDLSADSLNFNELIRAAIVGSEYTQKNSMEKDSISGLVLGGNDEIVMAVDTVLPGVFVVPRNLDLEFNSRIKNAKISDITINEARGRIILRDQTVHLSRIMLKSDIGSASTTMMYKAPNTKGAYLGIEMLVKRVDVKELVEAMPFIDELAPMLRSIEGMVDCNITAIAELDSLTNVNLAETTASCYLSGKDLVLLDGETFAEISKTLMFKNKNRNRIDSLSVEMIMEDEKLMVLPFRISMDRYVAAVGGVQHLDMSFDYHITVLKSPVPFKLGLNISGTLDDMKIRMGKAKYKNMFTAAKERKLDTTINLRQEMDEKLRKSIEDIMGMDISQPMRRPKSAMSDSLRRALFHLEDTIATSPIAVKEMPRDSVEPLYGLDK